jgi:hypothetical protein
MCVAESEVLFWMNAQNISCKSRRSRQQIRVSLERSPGESFPWIFRHESGWSYSTCQRTAKEVTFGFAEWQISTSCWIEVRRKDFDIGRHVFWRRSVSLREFQDTNCREKVYDSRIPTARAENGNLVSLMWPKFMDAVVFEELWTPE